MTEEAGAVAAEPQKRALGAASKRHSSERKRRKMERAAAASGKLTGANCAFAQSSTTPTGTAHTCMARGARGARW